MESRTRWEVRRNCRRFFEILSLYQLFVCSFVLLSVWVPRKFTLKEGGYVMVQHQDPTRDPVPWPPARVSGRRPPGLADGGRQGHGEPCPLPAVHLVVDCRKAAVT
jgi:hypothetical protein